METESAESFENIKDKLFTAPMLTYPNFDLPFILTKDASKEAAAAIFFKAKNGVERPIVYTSRQMNRAEQSYCGPLIDVPGELDK